MAKKYKHLENGVIAMQVIKKIFSLLEEKESISEIARLTGIARSTVRDYKMKSEGLGMSYEKLSSKSESKLLSLFKQNPRGPKKKSVENIDLDYCLKELMKKGVTKQVLYGEYYAKNPKDSLNNVKQNGSEEANLFAGPEIILTLGDNTTLQLLADFALDHDDSNFEVVPKKRIIASFNYLF